MDLGCTNIGRSGRITSVLGRQDRLQHHADECRGLLSSCWSGVPQAAACHALFRTVQHQHCSIIPLGTVRASAEASSHNAIALRRCEVPKPSDPELAGSATPSG